MKFSYNQIQSYFSKPLPPVDVLADAFTFHAFEIESIEKTADDTILDIKILPDRACYAKTIEGIALEVSTILNIKRKIPSKNNSFKIIPISIKSINEVLGTDIPKEEIISILARMDIGYNKNEGDNLLLAVPNNRLDLQTWRDIPEEIGRIYGYNLIKTILPKNTTFIPKVEKSFYYAEKIKNLLIDLGFSEVYTYSLVPKGIFKIEKPLASDKNHLRDNITEGINKALELNARNADLLGLNTIKIFEIGKVFTKNGEHTSLTIGIKNARKMKVKEKDLIKDIRDELFNKIQTDTKILCSIDDTGGLISLNNEIIGYTNKSNGVLEINLDKLIKDLPIPSSYKDLNFSKSINIVYKKISIYPFIVRDIAIFVPESIKSDEVWNIINKSLVSSENIDLLARYTLFDTFNKDGRVSYAFRLVFQSSEKTLTDDIVNEIMEFIHSKIKSMNWEVR